jgi:hypothetical protein
VTFIKKIAGYIPITLIMLISAAAFVPSFITNDITKELDKDYELLNDLQIGYDWITIQAENVYMFDSNVYSKMWDELAACQEIDTEWITLGSNATELQNQTFANKIFMHLGRISALAGQTYSFAIHTFFDLNNESNIYLFGKSSTNVPFVIERAFWEINPVYLQTTTRDFLNNIYPEWYAEPGTGFFFNETMDYLEANYEADLDSQINFLWAEDTPYTLDTRTNIYNLTHAPLIVLEQSIEELKFRIWDNEDLIANYQTVVSIMTVATLLATAISGRLEERRITHQLSKIRSEIQNDPEVVIPEIDRFSIGLLGIAVLVAILGLILVYVI